MAAPSNLVLHLLITAKDEASAAFGKIFSFLDKTTSATANLIREKFTNLFGGGLSGAIEFEAQLDRVQAKGGYTSDAMQTLKKTALDMAAAFGITGTEAAQGMESLAAAGLKTEEVMQALPPVLALAKAEGLSMDDASSKLVNSLTAVGLGFDQAGRMANVLTKAANESTTSASAVAVALSTAGGIARASGLSFEDTAAALTVLAKGGIEGERAGTALSAILTQLLNPASAASKELTALGITSRDFGTVMSELEQRGEGANSAILAFGETAGPGLRTFLLQGKGVMDEMKTSMMDVDGAAQAAADGMSGNLKGALAALTSAWENLKTALLDPLLEPITAQVSALAKAFQEGLSSDKFKQVQATIKDFGEAAGKAIGDFVKSFDFAGALAGLADFASSAKGHFETLASGGKAAADVVIIAWNGVTAGFKTIGAGMVEIVASIVVTLSNIEDAASRIGLGSAQRAAELRQKALEMQETAAGLIASVQQDATELGAAYDRLTTKSDAAADSQEKLKAALPTAQLKEVVYALSDYQKIADRANAATAMAAVDMEAGRISAQQYGEKLLDAAEANAVLAKATQAQADAAKAGAAAQKDTVQSLEKSVTFAQQYTDELDGLIRAQSDGVRAEIALAAAKGDTAEVQRLSADLAILEADGSARVAQAKWAEQQAEAALAIQKLAQLNAIKDKNAETQKQIELAVLTAQRELAEVQAAGVNAAAQETLAQKLREVRAIQSGAPDAVNQHTEAVQKNTDATEKSNQSKKDNISLTKLLNDAIAYSGQVTRELSAATENLFKQMLWSQNQKEALAFSTTVESYLYTLRQVPEAYAEINQKIADMSAASKAASDDILLATNSVARLFGHINKATADAQLAFYEQQLAAEKLADQYEKVAKTGETGFQAVGAALQQITYDSTVTIKSFDLLDQQDLSRLQAAIDGANNKLRQMQEETQSAKDRLAELNADILEAQGEDQKAAILTQQLDYQQQLAEVEKQRQDAELAGNRELLALLDEQERKLKTLNDLKLKNIQAEADTAASSSGSSRSAATSASAVAKTYELKLSGGAQSLTAYTDTDPSAFLSAMEAAQRVT
ncbi:MAG TPA: phage tail tape measure protein [Verrucomicrobiota bacterium]|nr:phage tail tape measure protein [Verrucomicrobiota bacterium]